MGTFQILFLLNFVTTGLQIVDSTYNHSIEVELRAHIFTTLAYQKQARPVSTVPVNITLNVNTFNSLDVRNQALTTTGYFTVTWSDARLDWTKILKFNADIFAIYADEETIWRPALILENSLSDISVMSDNAIPIRVLRDGTIQWNPSGIYKTLCETDVTFYPFDTQTCDISVSTWGYTANEIILNIDQEPLDLTYFKENGEWEYISYTSSAKDRGRGGNSFSSVTFHLKLKRRPMYHVLNMLIPTILLAFLSCMAFKLPPESGERIGFSLTVLLSYALYLTILADHMPTTSANTSLLSVYLVYILALGMISVVLTICVLECHHSDPETKVPKWLLKTVNILMIFSFQKKKDQSRCCYSNRNNIGSIDMSKEMSAYVENEEKKTAIVQEPKDGESIMEYSWLEVGRILDKSFLKISLFIVLTTTLLLMMALTIDYVIY